MKTIRKLLILLMAAIAILSLGSCSIDHTTNQNSVSDHTIDTTEKSQKPNCLEPYVLSEDQSKITDVLFGGLNNVKFFSFNTSNGSSKCSVWFNEYKKGQLVFTSAPVECNIDNLNNNGLIAITLNDNNIKIGISNTKTNMQLNGDLDNDIKNLKSQFWQDQKSINNAIDIVPSEEIYLLVYACNATVSKLQSPEYYVQNIEEIKEYDYLYIFKCSFINN